MLTQTVDSVTLAVLSDCGFRDLMIDNILNISQAVLAVILMAGVLMQARGTGLGAAFGGDSNIYRTKRGIEKRLFQATIVVAVLFFGVSLANVIF